jgi:hypothetical protein
MPAPNQAIKQIRQTAKDPAVKKDGGQAVRVACLN